MNPETLEALEESIAHWKRLASGNREPDENVGWLDCSLCVKFMRFALCEDCPVSKKTGAILCHNTPYKNAHRTRREYGLDSPEFKAAALEELAFLKSLLPNNHPSKPQ